MSLLRPIRPYHFQADLIWWDGRFNAAMMTRPRFMRPCKSSSLDYRSLLDMSCLVKNKNWLCVPVLIGRHKLGPNKHGQFVAMVRTLKGKCHEFENSYNGIQVIDLKNLGLPEHIFIPFWCHFHVLIIKKHAVVVSHLTVTLQMMSNSWRSLREWWVTGADQHRWSLLTYP